MAFFFEKNQGGGAPRHALVALIPSVVLTLCCLPPDFLDRRIYAVGNHHSNEAVDPEGNVMPDHEQVEVGGDEEKRGRQRRQHDGLSPPQIAHEPRHRHRKERDGSHVDAAENNRIDAVLLAQAQKPLGEGFPHDDL